MFAVAGTTGIGFVTPPFVGTIGGLVQVAGSGIAGDLFDAKHPRVVAEAAVEARDLDRVRAAFRGDNGDLFVGEPAVVGHVEHGLAERCLRHVGERLRRDRLRPLLELERNVTRNRQDGSRMRRPQRRDRRPVDDEIVVDLAGGSGGSSAARPVAPVPGRSPCPSRSTCSRGRACQPEQAARRPARRSPGSPGSVIAVLAGLGRSDRADRGGGDLGGRRLGAEAQAGLRLEVEGVRRCPA